MFRLKQLHGCTLAASLVACTSLCGQSQTWDFGLRLGQGTVLSSADPQGSRASFSVGLFGAWNFQPGRSFYSEALFRSFKSEDRDVTRIGSTGYRGDGTTFVLTTANAVDIRKDQLEGMALNFGYRQRLGATSWAWQAGAGLNFLRATQDVYGQFTWGSGTPSREGLNYQPRKTSVKPGIFGGVHANFTDSFFFEANLAYLAYERPEYQPRTYTNKPASVDSVSETKVVLDLSIGFRF